MICSEWKERAGAYALGMLDAIERAECEAHLATDHTHDGCWQALREANEAVALIGLSVDSVTPSAEVWQAIEERLPATIAPRRRAREWLAWSVAAAMLLVVVWVVRDRSELEGTLAAESDRASHDRTEQAHCVEQLAQSRADAESKREALELLTRPGTRLVALLAEGGATTTANVILHAESQRAFIVGRGLTAPSGKDYELWLIRGDRKIAAGLLRGDGTGAVLAAIDGKLLESGLPDAIAITLEPAGGGDAPRGPIVLVGKPGPG